MLKERFEELQQILLSEVRSFYQDRLVTLAVFGSTARGTYRFDSDLDILIIADDLPRGRMKRVAQFMSVEKKIESFLISLQKNGINTYISPIFKTPQEAEMGSPLFLDMVEDAQILFDRDGFFSKILERLRQKLKKLGARRVWQGNAWYWILKPDYKPGDVIEL